MKFRSALIPIAAMTLALFDSTEAGTMNSNRLVDFKTPGEEKRWVIVNDGVMGGLSTSTMLITEEGAALFEGRLSLENNGGFSSVRRLPDDYPLSGADAIVLRVRGDGRSYQFRVRTNDRYDGAAYRLIFDTEPDRWLTVRLPIADFRSTFRGRPVPGAPALEPERIRQIGFLIGDKRPGPFRLEIGEIRYSREGDGLHGE